MRYPIEMKRDGRFLLVTFPDIPEAITQGRNLEEARQAAADALESALDFYFDASRQVPLPSRVKSGDEFVELAPSLSAKVLLLNEMLRQRVRPAELARLLETRPQDVNRLLDLHHTSKIDGIAGALKALGKTLEVRAV
ncbi:MAG: type II toxin-antitoxin system HicB family antitoxin [Edaphobacter sp.]